MATAKLSKKMQAVMDSLQAAEYYYKVGDDGGIIFHGTTGRRYIGFQETWIYADGSHGLRENTSTLEALEKRGLLKIVRAGGNCVDAVEVVGKINPEPLKTAGKIIVKETDKEDGKTRETIEYYDKTATTPQEIQATYNLKRKFYDFEVTEIGEVELNIWDLNK